MRGAAARRRIRELRPPKAEVDPWRPLGVTVERERVAADPRASPLIIAKQVPSITVFLAGAECPFTCAHCDLWRYTLDGPTPPGALAAQLLQALEGLDSPLPERPPPGARLKLYNASNFFEPRAVPPGEEELLLPLVKGFDRVVVECHPKLVGERCFAFAEALARHGVTLEVALGLESASPPVLERLNKAMTLDDFDDAVVRLSAAGLPSRAFILVGAPYSEAGRVAEEAAAAAAHALSTGVETVVLIPVRGGNGELERLRAEGHFTPPTLKDLERALDLALPMEARHGGVVLPDLWDLQEFSRCSACFPARRDRLQALAASGPPLLPMSPVRCAQCESSA